MFELPPPSEFETDYNQDLYADPDEPFYRSEDNFVFTRVSDSFVFTRDR